jgi:Xaa-Pro dipeptidase
LTLRANEISTIAHTAVLKAVKTAKNERELEAIFLERCIANGCREQAYHSIVASGTAAATLHYVKNYEPLAGKLNLLLDAGGEYGCYASDIVSVCSSLVVKLLMLTSITDSDIPYLW